VGAALGVQAGVGDAKPLNGAASDEVLSDDFVGVLGSYSAIPDGIGVDDHGGAVLALVEAAGLVDADAAGEAGFAGELREAGVERALTVGSARGARRVGGADVVTDEDVAFERWHGFRIAESAVLAELAVLGGSFGLGRAFKPLRGCPRSRASGDRGDREASQNIIKFMT
jgi:hypothetical protein